MKTRLRSATLVATIVILFGVSYARETDNTYGWKLPPGLPRPQVPEDNPMSAAKVELGRHLFYDKRLSLNQEQACASCHVQARAFTDGRAQAIGSTGEVHPRSSMSLVNVAYVPALGWANPALTRLEDQALVPMFGDSPVELGFHGNEDVLLARLEGVPQYQRLFPSAFPESKDPFTINSVVRALASFERTILSGDAPYDRYWRGTDPNALSAAAKRGEYLFTSERFGCFHCHAGLNLANAEDFVGKGYIEIEYDNTALYKTYPAGNAGLFEVTRKPDDRGKFRVPTLRNIELTAPYMHDGSVATLEDVIDHYSAGGRTILEGPHAGGGADNANKSFFLQGFEVSPEERRDLIEFLKSLTDTSVLTNPALSDPWKR